MNFEPDSRYQEVAVAYAADAVDYARNTFNKKLDYSNSSLNTVDEILGELHHRAMRDCPAPEAIYQFAKMFGSYIGEVFRLAYGAEWGIVELNGEKMPGLRAAQKSKLFWPWGKANGRIVNGAEDNIVYYYHVLTEGMEPLSKAPTDVPNDSPPTETEAVEAPVKPKKVAWYRRLFDA